MAERIATLGKRVGGVLAVVVVLMLTVTSGCGFQIVDTGHRGVETRFGKVQGESLPEGLYFYNPLTSTIIEMDVRETKWTENSSAYTKDVQNVDVHFSANFHPEPTMIHVLYEKIGRDWAQKVVPQIIMGELKGIIGRYEAVKLVSEREQATAAITLQITEKLKEKSVVLKNFEITNLDFNNPFEHAVEAKVVAIQQAEEAKNKTVKVREEAEQKIISARAEAESMRIRANALTQNRSLVEYEAVQKWDGKLPEIMTSGSTMPFINVGKGGKSDG
ncbi:MAG: prohibitin family protein [Bdellovibrionales bacterium]|nr:prohibitin family protein [Bdellovibrionales bacterium]